MTCVAEFRVLDDVELNAVGGGSRSDAWGAIGLGLGTIGAGLALEGASVGLGTPVAFAVIAVGVASVHAGVIQLATER